MDILTTNQNIEKKIKQLDSAQQLLKERAEAKAETIAKYEKQIAITLIKLKNGQVFELDGEKIENPPVSICEKLAKGICWKEKLDMEKAEAEYKNIVKGLESLEAQLNGYQSILRYMQ